jgi:DNA-binding MarR family transcriptional regulator
MAGAPFRAEWIQNSKFLVAKQFVYELRCIAGGRAFPSVRWLSSRHGFDIISFMSSPIGSEDDLLLERQLCFALALASRTVISAYRPVLQALDLTHPQYLVMLALWERSPRSVKDISGELLLGPATLSPLLKRLEASGYVRRQRVPNDERSLAVSLTPSGTALRTKALAVPGIMLSKLGLSREEAQELHLTMSRLARAAQIDHAEAGPCPAGDVAGSSTPPAP